MNRFNDTPVPVVYQQFLRLIHAAEPFTPLPAEAIPHPEGDWLHRSQIAYLREQNNILGDIRAAGGMTRAVPNEEAAIRLLLNIDEAENKGAAPLWT